MKFRKVEKILVADGWYFVYSNDSHRYYKHPTKKGKICIPFHGGEEIPPGTLSSILKQAGLK